MNEVINLDVHPSLLAESMDGYCTLDETRLTQRAEVQMNLRARTAAFMPYSIPTTLMGYLAFGTPVLTRRLNIRDDPK